MKINWGSTTAKMAMLMTLLTFSSVAAAEVVYTQANVTITGTGSIRLDLDHDRKADFVLHADSRIGSCGLVDDLLGLALLTPMAGDGVVAIEGLQYAAVLDAGVSVDASSNFRQNRSIVTQFIICNSGTKTVAGYLGLKFQINGETHYGWAQVNIQAIFVHTGGSMTTEVIDYAYETVPGQAIETGQTSANVDNAGSVPESIPPIDFGSGSPVAPVSDYPLAESLTWNALLRPVE